MEVTIKNGNRYRQSATGLRKLCRLPDCMNFSCGEWCLKHKPDQPGLKRCTQCIRQKKPEEFVKDGVTYARCMVCLRKALRASKIRYAKKQKLLLDLKKRLGGKCVHCGIDDIEVLEFDHMISADKVNCVRKIYNKEGIINEAFKCQLLCANCHMKKSLKSSKATLKDISEVKYQSSHRSRTQARDYVAKHRKDSNGCEMCGWYDGENLSILQFDHKDPKQKVECISRLVSSGCNLEKLKEEMDKCRLLCANCHRKYTLRQMNYNIIDLIESQMGEQDQVITDLSIDRAEIIC
jgi:hypothetical protein